MGLIAYFRLNPTKYNSYNNLIFTNSSIILKSKAL